MAEEQQPTDVKPQEGAPAVLPEGSSFLSRVREYHESRGKQDDAGEPPATNIQQQDALSQKKTESGDSSTDAGDEANAAGSEDKGDVEAKPSDDLVINPLDNQKKEKKSKEENLKALRNSLNAEREAKRQLEQKLQSVEEKLQSGGDVDEYRSKLEAAEARITELEKYESLVGLKQSKEYKEKYITGIDNLLEDAQAIAKDYEVPNQVLQQAVQTGNRRELNTLLAEHFDTVAVGDIRPIILKIQNLLVEKKKIESNPADAEKELIKAAEEREKREASLARKRMQNVVQESWADTQNIYSTPDSGVDILQEVAGDEEHNNTKKEVTKKAADAYGKVMGIFAKDGLRQIDSETAKALASRFQLAEVAGHLIAENQALKEQLDASQKKLKQRGSYSRPLSAGNNARNSRQPAEPEPTSDNLAATIFSRAQEKARTE